MQYILVLNVENKKQVEALEALIEAIKKTKSAKLTGILRGAECHEK